jgi:uncharacterized protein (DUF2236 family)
VHNSLTGSFLAAYRAYGAQPCPEALADSYVAEQVRLGRLIGASPLPETAIALTTWLRSHPGLAPSPGSVDAVRFLRRPPLPSGARFAYGLLFRAAVAILPGRVLDVVGVRARPGDLEVGRIAVKALRLALGASADWDLALQRTGASPPPGVRFRQPPRSRPATVDQNADQAVRHGPVP